MRTGKMACIKCGAVLYLIEWSYCGSAPTDIYTWVFDTDLVITRRPKGRT